jgi:hypothetical protein
MAVEELAYLTDRNLRPPGYDDLNILIRLREDKVNQIW